MIEKKKTALKPFFLLLFLIFVLTACSAGESKEGKGKQNAAGKPSIKEFSCYAVDSRGKTLQGYLRETDGIWYLFVPSTLNISDLKFHYTGNVTECSSGELDSETSTVTGAFTNERTQVELKDGDGGTAIVVAMQSNLPSVQIYLKDTTLALLHQDKDEKYENNTFMLTDSEGTYNLYMEDCVQIKGRGNSSWREYDKKGYQIKFPEETGFLGMRKARKWVLLANASDDSMIRTKLVYQMAEKLNMAFVPDMEYVDLWIDGEYLGTYLLGEKVEIGSSRLDLTNPAGALFEHDEAFYSEEDYWLYNDRIQRHFTLKEIVTEEKAIIESAMESFDSTLNELMMYLFSTPPKEVTLKDLSRIIDVDSFAKYYLINEYVMNKESYATSFYWYQDGPNDVLHMGPIWDYDTCMGNDGTAVNENYGDKHLLYWILLNEPVFKERIETIYSQHKDVFDSMADNVSRIKAEIEKSAEMNYLRWDVLGTSNPKNRNLNLAETFDEAVSSLETWLRGREKNFHIPSGKMVTSVISDDYRTMDVYFEPGIEYENVRFLVWSMGSNPREIQEYHAELVDGVWHCVVDLTRYRTTGMYSMDVYLNDDDFASYNGFNYIEHIGK